MENLQKLKEDRHANLLEWLNANGVRYDGVEAPVKFPTG